MNEFDLFQAALDLEDAEARKLFLQSHCEHDAELLNRVEALLASHEGQSRFLETPVVAQIAHLPDAWPVTMLAGNGSTQGDDPESTKAYSTEPAAMPTPQDSSDDEIPLDFLLPSSKPDSLGRLGHYEVLEVIGRGAFGTVLRAFDEKLHRVVAIKVMAPEIAATSPARKRFLREAQASAAIRHEHVVSIYAVEEKPLPYLVMEYIPGETLQQRVDSRGPLDVLTVLHLGRQIAEGLAAAHAQDLIHRDIKPGNILLETSTHDRIKLTDFGLARAADDASLSQSGTIAGTPMYMAPEQALGKKLDVRADLFSFGSVLYQMVSGRPPFRAPSALAVLKRVAEEAARPIEEIIPETPHWLCDIILKLHAKNPDERFQSAREVADLLADCEAKLKARLDVKSVLPVDHKPVGHNRLVAVGLVVSLIIVALVLTEFTGATNLFQPSAKLPIESITDPSNALAAKLSPDAEGFVQLFNGTDLAGWKTHPVATGDWRVGDGAISGQGTTSYLFSESGDYSDFHLRVEAKVNGNGDAGIYFRTPFQVLPHPNPGPARFTLPAGYEAAIALGSNYSNHTGSLTAADGSTLQAGPQAPHQPDEWFVLEVIAEGNHIRVFVDGKLTADHYDEQRRFSRGHIALQTWGRNITHVQFRKIEIRQISRESADSTTESAVKAVVASDGHSSTIHLNQAQLVDVPSVAKAPHDAAQAKAHQEAWAKHLGIDVQSTNDLVGKLVLIPPGEFQMGTTPDQNAFGQKILEGDSNSPDPNISRRLPAEMPQHRVVLTKPFFMAATEVTVARFRKFVDATGYETTADREGSGNTNRAKSDEVPANTRGRNWRKPGVPQADESPVSQVTWNDACVFCNWLSEQEQLSSWYQLDSSGFWRVSPQADGYRLPTEAEWEYACRAGTTTQFSFGDDTADLARYAWYRLSNNDGLQPVGTKSPNPFGLYDMHGNVTEFCQDAYDEKWYGISPELDPLQKNGSGIVARGGNWYVGPFECRSASRKNYSRTHRYWALGFRVVRPISAATAKVETKS